MLAHAAIRHGRIETAALHHRNRRVSRERRIDERHLAEVEPRSARGGDDPNVPAPGAEPRGVLLDLPGRSAIVHHDRMFTSEAVTRGVRVRVESEYSPDKSQPGKNQWFFLYTVTISNEGDDAVQLLARHWIITDGKGRVEESDGGQCTVYGSLRVNGAILASNRSPPAVVI